MIIGRPITKNTRVITVDDRIIQEVRLFPDEDGVTMTVVDTDEQGIIPVESIEAAVTENTKLIAVGHISNFFGAVQDVPAPAHDVGHDPTDTDAVRRVALGGDWWAEQDAKKGRG